MGLTISSLFTRLFGKKQMRILMGRLSFVYFLFEKKYSSRIILSLGGGIQRDDVFLKFLTEISKISQIILTKLHFFSRVVVSGYR